MANTIKPASVSVRPTAQSSAPAAPAKPAAPAAPAAPSTPSSSFSSTPASSSSTARALGSPDAPPVRTAAPTASTQSAVKAEDSRGKEIDDASTLLSKTFATHKPITAEQQAALDKLPEGEKKLYEYMHQIGSGNRTAPSGLSEKDKAIWDLAYAFEYGGAKTDDLAEGKPLYKTLEKACEGMDTKDANAFVGIVRSKAIRNLVRKSIMQDMMMATFMSGQKPG